MNNTPNIGPYTELKPFRFWCQKVLPLVYDESLSYYELLCKVVDYLNKTMEDVDQMIIDMGEFQDAYTEFIADVDARYLAFTTAISEEMLQFKSDVNTAITNLETFVNDYFDNLDVQDEIDHKIDEMAEEGYFDELFVRVFGDNVIGTAQTYVTAWISANLSQQAGFVVDKSLTVDDAAADAKTVGDKISLLKQNTDSMRKAFPKSTNLFNIYDPDGMDRRYITPDGTEYESTGGTLSESGWIAVEPSTHYVFGADGILYPRYVTEYDSGKNVISNSGADSDNITTTASTAYIRFAYRNDYNNWRMNKSQELLAFEPFYYDYIKTDDTLTDEYLPANAKSVGDTLERAGFSDQTYAADDVLALTFTDGYIGLNGGEAASTVLHYSNQINVAEGDTLYTDGTSAFRFVCAYNAQGSAVSAKGAESVFSYTVPSGISKIVVTTYKSYTGTIRHIHNVTAFVASNGQLGYFRAEGNLSNGDALALPVTNVNKNIRQVFTADITAFGSLLIGRKNGNQGFWAVIDATNITVYRDNVASEPVPHGLTITNNVQVRIITRSDLTTPNDLYNADITITSNGESFTAQNISWVRTYNTPIVQSIGSTLINCVMSWEAGDVNKAIYMFGDSYFSWYPERWPYYCAKDGFANNALFNAFAGENTANAIIALQNVVPMGRPKYLVWCLGMNDGSDTSSEPSSAWVLGRDAVINICKRYGITPIFATIPTVPTINNEQKNAWIRSSGYRYIDFAKAVGADANGSWFEGMLEDGTHPTIKGAKALYGRLLTDLPEIMIQN